VQLFLRAFIGFLTRKKIHVVIKRHQSISQHKVHTGQPKPRDPADSPYTPISGESEKEITTLHKKEIYRGLFEEQRRFYPQFSEIENEGRQPKRMKSDQGDGEDLPPESKVGLPGMNIRKKKY